MATRADEVGPSRDESQVCLKTLKFESAVSFALRCLESSDFVLKPQQKEAIRLVWEGKDVFIFLPTGFGKSIIYEVLPFLFDHKLGRVDARMRSLVIVVSPFRYPLWQTKWVVFDAGEPEQLCFHLGVQLLIRVF